MKNYKAVAVLGIGILVVIAGAFLFNSSDRSEAKDSRLANIEAQTDDASLKLEWKDKVDEYGVERAYNLFKEELQDEKFADQHASAHVMGELLYDEKGIDGLAICDATFAFGCYHSFFIKAISEHGLSVIPRLDESCIEKYGKNSTGCQHGIGHGIMQYMGHANIEKGTEACEKTTQVSPFFGCIEGLFMEYNMPVEFTADRIKMNTREFSDKNPYKPCNTVVPEDSRKGCYYSLPEWWTHALGDDMERVGELCAGIESKEYRASCFLAMGNAASFTTEYNLEKTIQGCEASPTDFGEKMCRIGASWRFSNLGSEKSSQTDELCSPSDSYSTYSCMTN